MENKDNVNVQTEKKKVRKIGRLTFGITLILSFINLVAISLRNATNQTIILCKRGRYNKMD